MSIHLRHPGSVPALFSREIEARPPRRGIAALWHGLTVRSRRTASRELSVGEPALGWLALSLVLLAAEAPMIQAAETLLSLAVPG